MVIERHPNFVGASYLLERKLKFKSLIFEDQKFAIIFSNGGIIVKIISDDDITIIYKDGNGNEFIHDRNWCFVLFNDTITHYPQINITKAWIEAFDETMSQQQNLTWEERVHMFREMCEYKGQALTVSFPSSASFDEERLIRDLEVIPDQDLKESARVMIINNMMIDRPNGLILLFINTPDQRPGKCVHYINPPIKCPDFFEYSPYRANTEFINSVFNFVPHLTK